MSFLKIVSPTKLAKVSTMGYGNLENSHMKYTDYVEFRSNCPLVENLFRLVQNPHLPKTAFEPLTLRHVKKQFPP